MLNGKNILILLVTALLAPFFVCSAALADMQGQNVIFSVNKSFDKSGRESMPATLRYMGENSYFYVDDEYWNALNSLERRDFLTSISQLSSEFDVNIYPKETSFWGQEARPGVDGDSRITILLEQLKTGNGGYFSSVNGYAKKTVLESNEREMMVVSAESVNGQLAKVFLAHEFEHLISFNQKETLRNIYEEVWLNELRAEYSVTLAGYNDIFSDSNLKRRADKFFNSPSDSLTEWPNLSQDYDLVSLFGEYISEEYGNGFLKKSLQSELLGIPSIDAALAFMGNSDRFSNIFSNWLIASYINDDSSEPKFGYARPELGGLQASPQRITILSSDSHIFDYTLKPWQPYGHKFYTADLESGRVIKLFPSPTTDFKFVYADNLGRADILTGNFFVTNPGGLKYFYIFPVNSSKTVGFGSSENEFNARLTLSFDDKLPGVEFGSAFKNGALIKKTGEKEIYVIEGKYKRYLRPEIIALYGHLDTGKVMEVDVATFNFYSTANYVRYVNDKRVYAVWPDGTKHWLNITPQQWDDSGRDWNAIFIINDLELAAYKTGADITR
ncbi:MAG: hypothetical protein AAB461_00015 [Patescibacteria group bacterium]